MFQKKILKEYDPLFLQDLLEENVRPSFENIFVHFVKLLNSGNSAQSVHFENFTKLSYHLSQKKSARECIFCTAFNSRLFFLIFFFYFSIFNFTFISFSLIFLGVREIRIILFP